MRLRFILDKYKNMSDALKAGLWFTICFVIQRGIQFIGMPIYTRLMPQTDYGVYSTFTSWAHILVIASSLNIYSGIFNKAMIKYEDEKEQYISSIQSLTTLTSAILAGIVIILKEPLSLLLNMDERCMMLMALYIMTFPPIQYWSQRQRFAFKYKSIIAITLINSLLNLGLGILFVLLASNDKGIALVDAVVIVQAAVSVALYIYLFWKGRCIYNKEYWIWSLGLAIPLLPHYFSEILLGHADRIMINSMCGSDKAAIYNIAYQISMVMTIVRTGINGAYLPWEFKEIKAQKYDTVKSTTNMYAILMFSMTIFCMLIGPELLKIVAPASYYEAIYDIPAIMAGCFFIFEYVLFMNVEMYYEQKQYVAIASFVAAIANVILNYVCIKQWGYLAAGYTTAVSYAIMIEMHYTFFKRIAKKYEEIREFYNIKLLLGLMLATTAFAILSLFLYANNIIRYVFIVAMIIAAYIYRERIIGLIKLIRSK